MNPILVRSLGTVVLVAVLILAGGCRTSPPPTAPVANPSVAARNNAASLLYDLMGDERHVSKLLLVKRESPELERLIKNISSTCAQAHSRLEELARNDPSLNLKSTSLPPGEAAAREAESKTRSSLLLRSSGADFEFHLLFSQAQALGYAEQLAAVAAAHNSDPGAGQSFTDLSQKLRSLQQQVLAMMRAPRSVPPK